MDQFWTRQMLTVFLFWVLINPGLAQYWCPGSNIPAVCCSRLLNGDITDAYAKFETSFVSPMNGYHDVEVGNDKMSIADCHEACKVCCFWFLKKH